MNFCKNCGNKLKDGVKFCDNCGTKVSLEKNEYIKAENKNSGEGFKEKLLKKYSKRDLIIAGVILAAVVVFFVILIVNYSKPSVDTGEPLENQMELTMENINRNWECDDGEWDKAFKFEERVYGIVFGMIPSNTAKRARYEDSIILIGGSCECKKDKIIFDFKTIDNEPVTIVAYAEVNNDKLKLTAIDEKFNYINGIYEINNIGLMRPTEVAENEIESSIRLW